MRQALTHLMEHLLQQPKHKSRVNSKDENSRTPLLYAVKNGREAGTQLLEFAIAAQHNMGS
jgi:ankyrin repeat protein